MHRQNAPERKTRSDLGDSTDTDKSSTDIEAGGDKSVTIVTEIAIATDPGIIQGPLDLLR
jgi:hypothetical protein